ncbi:hypothetical protein Godav_001556 [Gossypium davidsonii]|uniref:Cellulose synthase n=1 Tax=Gossypium davidsonii TaxID=34287 RepID=A0A7J8T3G6_GOSDV|nr:hypothetical protein [Gossypium davidsonii]
MQMSCGLVVGTHNSNELLVIRRHGDDSSPKTGEHLIGQTCNICGDEVGLTTEGELFVACNECAFPICRVCYDYERKEGNQTCPRCKTRFKRLKGCPRVEGDEEEDEIDDLENEFSFEGSNNEQHHFVVHREPQLSLLSNGHKYLLSHLCSHFVFFFCFLQLLAFPTLQILKDLTAYGYGTVAWKETWKQETGKLQLKNSYNGCKDVFPDGLDLPLYEEEGQPSQLAHIDIFVTTVDPLKESPLVTANTVLSILAVDYPVDKLSCYVSDDGASLLTFEALFETSEFARKWVPFCNKFNVEPRAPEWYFSRKVDYFKDKILPSFVMERRAMKREYEEFKIRINTLVAKAQKAPKDGWIMQDGTPWPGNNTHHHPGMIQVFLGQGGRHDANGNELPRLVYVSREKGPSFNHHKKAEALNALVRVSAVLTNAPYLLNVDYNHYINNSKALKEAMCFMMDPLSGKRVNMKGLDGIQGPIYTGTGCVFRRVALYGYDAPKPKKPPTRTCNCWHKWCCGCLCLRRKKKQQLNKLPKTVIQTRHTKQGDEEALPLMSATMEAVEEGALEKMFGQSPVFIASTLVENGETFNGASLASRLREAIHVIGCGYEEKTEWGKEVGWMYGSVTENILTGFKMHSHGWRSVHCVPARLAFKGFGSVDLEDHLQEVLGWALGSIEIFLSRHCPIWYGYGGGLKLLERIAYINVVVYPWTSIPLLAYCTLPAVCLFTGKFIIPELSSAGSLWFLSLFICIFATNILEMKWNGISINEWWRNEQLWVIGAVSAQLFAVSQGLLKIMTGINTNSSVTSKVEGDNGDFSQLCGLKWTTLLIPTTTLLIINIVGVIAGIAKAINNGYDSWGPFFGKFFFAFWVIAHLYPLLKGLSGRQSTPTIVVVWSVLLASIFVLVWVRLDPFLPESDGPSLVECGLDCK